MRALNEMAIFHFSWKQKLSIVIGITLAGLLFVAGSAFLGLNAVNNSVNKQNAAIHYKQNLLELSNSLLQLDASLAKLNPENIDAFVSILDSLTAINTDMQQSATTLNNEELITLSNQLVDITNNYVATQKQWIDNGLSLGFTPEQGRLGQLFNALASVEKIRERLNKVL